MNYTFFKKITLLSFIFVLFSCLFLNYLTIDVLADSYKNFGLETTLKEGEISQALTKEAPQTIVGRIIGVVLSFIGVGFFVLVVYAGISWMMAAGNEQKISHAKQIIIAATIGLILVLSAYAITAYIGNTLTR